MDFFANILSDTSDFFGDAEDIFTQGASKLGGSGSSSSGSKTGGLSSLLSLGTSLFGNEDKKKSSSTSDKQVLDTLSSNYEVSSGATKRSITDLKPLESIDPRELEYKWIQIARQISGVDNASA